LDETVIIGTWRYDAPIPPPLIYHFDKDKTCSFGLEGKNADVTGTWEITNRELIIVMKRFETDFGNLAIFGASGGKSNATRITKLEASRMDWRNPGQWGEMRLTRTNPPAGRKE
jgi:hypothetical protein